jgi:L-lactate dehydrogenase
MPKQTQFYREKITIVGAGNVGSAIAYALTIRNVASEINLIDLNAEKSLGEVMDIADGLSFVETGHVRGSSFEAARDADILIVTAGARQQPGQTRLDLTKVNKDIIKSIFKKIGKLKPSAIVIMVSNPVDVLTYYAQEILKIPNSQIIGTGTTLDTSRLRTKLAKHFNISPQNVHGYVLGEHGDSEFVAWDSLTIGGTPIKKIKGFTAEVAKKMEHDVRREAYHIIAAKGSTYYGIGLTVANIVKAILYDQHLVLPVSSRVTNWNGVSNVCLGSLTIVGRKGAEGHWPLDLSTNEKKKLQKSAEIIKSYL